MQWIFWCGPEIKVYMKSKWKLRKSNRCHCQKEQKINKSWCLNDYLFDSTGIQDSKDFFVLNTSLDKFIFTEKNCKFNWWMNFLQISLFLLIQVMIITQLLLMAISLYKCFSCMRREIEIPYPLWLPSWLPKIYICGKNIFKVCFLNNPTTFAMFIYYFQKYFNFINSQNGV